MVFIVSLIYMAGILPIWRKTQNIHLYANEVSYIFTNKFDLDSKLTQVVVAHLNNVSLGLLFITLNFQMSASELKMWICFPILGCALIYMVYCATKLHVYKWKLQCCNFGT